MANNVIIIISNEDNSSHNYCHIKFIFYGDPDVSLNFMCIYAINDELDMTYQVKLGYTWIK